ncbi:hypothetical protein COL93_18000 [Bacillus toyonensis]|uniref:Uncharacterized protein n=1 Tax=Bacillus toyonensis TaxID=155322 RepID=A0A2C4QYX6_9BACI|nr:hypothetical protein COL93_18000 [Bacillus toyonensis]PHD69690.1 hypothetical protein COF40_14585 [Bacillus toyonensis]
MRGILCTNAPHLSRYLWKVRLPPQNSAGTKKLGGSPAARKPPLIKVSLYYFSFKKVRSFKNKFQKKMNPGSKIAIPIA